MSKKFLQSLTILGLLSTALGVAQPVGAVVSGRFQDKIEEIKRDLEKLDNSVKLQGQLRNKANENLSRLLDIGKYLMRISEFQEEEYAVALKELTEAILAYDEIIVSLPTGESGTEGYKNLFNKNYSKVELSKVEKKFGNLSQEKYQKIKSGLEDALVKFSEDIYKIQIENEDLFSIGYHNENGYLASEYYYDYYGYYEQGYYDEFFTKYITPKLQEDFSNSLITSYNSALSETMSVIKAINRVIKKAKEKLSKQETDKDSNLEANISSLENEFLIIMQLDKKDSNITSNLTKEATIIKEIVLSEDFPNIRITKRKLSLLKAALYDYCKVTDILDKVRVLKDYKPEENMVENPSNKYKTSEEQIENYKKTMQDSAKNWEQLRIENLKRSNINNPNYKIPEEEVVGEYDENGDLITGKLLLTEDYAKKEKSSIIITETTEEPKEFKITEESAQPSKTAAQVTDETLEVTVELPQPGQAKAAEPVSSPLDAYTKSQINFWIEDFNTSLNKINYSGIYSEYLESLITRGKQLRNKLDKALGENKSSDDIKRDLDQLEMISNTITSVGNTRNS
ncbi:hypothetical protein [Streptococcus halichoeri]|uniref:hypothetical protein n=1 Tax=Streptococcus halichoeri TaxID=254785 RepID=UPI001359F73A|nr:hypothetical protein [Streptococcus halichoeri]